MPKYLSLNDYKGYSIKAKPVGLRGLLPFWIGNKVAIRFVFEEASDKRYTNPLSSFRLVEIHANNAYKESYPLAGMSGIAEGIEQGKFDTKFISRTVVSTGDFSIYIGDGSGVDLKNPLFSTNIVSGDIMTMNIALMLVSALVGAVFSFIVGIALGFFEVPAYWLIR